MSLPRATQLFFYTCLTFFSFSCKKTDGSVSPSAKGTPSVNPTDGKATSTGDASASVMPMTAANNGVCRLAVECHQDLPDFGPASGFKRVENKIKASLPGAVHRGRDALINEGQDAILIAKFAFNIATDADIVGEDVDIYMSNGCDKGWSKIGSAVTSENGSSRVIDSVVDTGGYVMASLKSLGVSNLAAGRYHFVLVLKGNNDTTELYVEVLANKSAVVLTDVDGTLTGFEEAAATEIVGIHPESHVGAADMMRSFYTRGYTIFYLTARPAFLMSATREWLNLRGFPPGIIHTTTFKVGAVGEAAAAFKVTEIDLLKKNLALTPTYAFGNKASDVKAFGDAGISKADSYFYKLSGDTTGANVQSDYRKLISMAQKAPSFCP